MMGSEAERSMVEGMTHVEEIKKLGVSGRREIRGRKWRGAKEPLDESDRGE